MIPEDWLADWPADWDDPPVVVCEMTSPCASVTMVVMEPFAFIWVVVVPALDAEDEADEVMGALNRPAVTFEADEMAEDMGANP
ncbi:hypothetical protein [Acidomonas methanolica]|uniref:Uncharacterized protein n=1 Tax=Acidomonas methanolica NBRC 104435 TaxID=1231351 RepID=A0A023D6R7_ACIMT|nr:hypothetical protein [Acidomonas methanolica]GAJ29843.1 hypothetical protein Amme_083_018 [Acidomonas methanolica NBRC 104435]GBQ56952.1 hypothetical protein AA0498_2455 [Acidomonas methanolica]GEL00192.1 hypothetical protein AME01nite_26900 [Acidomonas methanolica NBRC 104435]